MNKKERVAIVAKELEKHFPHPPIPLKHKDPYTLLVAVVLSAQCSDAKVNEVTPALFASADTPVKMAKLSVGEIESKIKTLGLYRSKAKHLQQLSKIIVEEHGGHVPQTFQALEALPGVGHKTASVVMSQAFHQPAFPVDTHVERLAHRWGLSTGKSIKKIEEDLKKLFPKNSWGKTSLQIILFGRRFCPARAHSVDACPICSKIL